MGREQEEIIAQAIRDKIKTKYTGSCATRISASIGIAEYPMHGDTYLDLFKKADKALYQAKANGKISL